MYTIMKRWTFDASHQLHGLPRNHKCGRLHGHTYTVEVEIISETLDEHGFVVDFGDLAPIKRMIDMVFDHRHLNDIMPGGINPTAENLARTLYEHISMMFLIAESRQQEGAPGQTDIIMSFPRTDPVLFQDVRPLRDDVAITAVRVSETGSTWAECRP